jgi:hypothetical protein
MFKISIPTPKQIIASLERVVAVFLIAAFSVWQVTPDKFSKATGAAAVTAGFTAVYQLLKGVLTTL